MATAPVEAVEKPKATSKLAAGRMFPTGQYTHDREVRVPHGTVPDDLLRPEFWAIYGQHVGRMDRIHILWDDGTHYARVLVIDQGVGFIKAHILESHSLEASSETYAPQSAMRIEWKGVGEKYSVIRNSDQVMLRNGFRNRDLAEQWVREYLKTIAR